MGPSVAALRPYLLGLDWLIAVAWTLRTLQCLRGFRRVPDLLRMRPATAGLPVRLSVIVPACNEEAAIEKCLRSLLASTGLAAMGAALEVLAVNDRSTDGTGRRMDEVASAEERLRVIDVTALPEGWMGKTHAMGLAAAQAAAVEDDDWLLFTDGDIVFQPEALARALSFAIRQKADHVVLYPTMIFKSFGERMMLSFLHALSTWGMRPWKVSDPAARHDFIGIGAFNLVRRSTYNAAGGWSALRLEVLEDLRLGFTIKRAGFHQVAVFGCDLVRVRWAEGAFGVVNNMTKNLFAVFRFRLLPAALACGGILAGCLLPFVALSLGRAALAPCLLLLGTLAVLYARFHRLGLPNAAYVLTFPLGALLFLFALARSIVKTSVQRGVTWRGTFYPLAALRKHAGPLR